VACPATPNHKKTQEYILHVSLGRPHLPGRLYIGLFQNYDTPQSNAPPPGYTKMQKTHGFWRITTNSIRWWVFTSMLVSWCSRKYSNVTFRAYTIPFTHSEGHSFHSELTWAQHPWHPWHQGHTADTSTLEIWSGPPRVMCVMWPGF